MTTVLALAALYNILWGGWVVLFPDAMFRWSGAEPLNHPGVWQCVGMIVGVYGVGYAIAATDPIRHWPIIFVGLLGKVLGPIGFAITAARGELPWAFGVTILTNDLIWWVPFVVMLRRAWVAPSLGDGPLPIDRAIDAFADQRGRTLRQLSQDAPTLVVFLRHLGCSFCREALADISRARGDIERDGARIALVHMGDETDARVFDQAGLGEISRVSDPSRELYRAFGLERGSFLQLFGPRVWLRGLAAAMRGHKVGALRGDGFQMPGAFLLENGRVRRAYRHRTAADRPDYTGLSCPMPGSAP